MRSGSAFAAGVGSALIVAIGWQAGAGALSQATAASSTTPTTTTKPSSAATSAAAAPAPSASASASASAAPAASPSASTSASAAPAPAASASASASAAPAPSESASTAGAVDGTYTGSAVNTRYGPAQVQVVIAGGQISDVIVLQRQQNDQKSNQISSRAVPTLRQQVLTAQSANVAGVSGATYTSASYLQSVQSALDAAGFTG
jgi:uncharacterized protein with FMN-binding domain